MKKKIFLAYDYYKLKDGTKQYGVSDILIEYLEKNKISYYAHSIPISTSLKSLIRKFYKLKKEIEKFNLDVFVGYNFLNAFYALVIRALLRRKYKVIFVAVDFTKERFQNILLNQIYIFMDYFVSKISDETWNCSSKVFEYRSHFLNPNKNFYMPNIPNYQKENLKKFEDFTIVMISFLNENYLFEDVYQLFDYIKNKHIKLLIIGDGNRKDEIQNKINQELLQDKVKLTGYLPHLEIRKILEQSHLGLALYGGKESYNFWGDSMKIREYTYYELPVITTKNVNNYKEIIKENLGSCLEDYNSLPEITDRYFNNKKDYQETVKSCQKYNLKYKIDNMFKERLN